MSNVPVLIDYVLNGDDYDMMLDAIIDNDIDAVMGCVNCDVDELKRSGMSPLLKEIVDDALSFDVKEYASDLLQSATTYILDLTKRDIYNSEDIQMIVVKYAIANWGVTVDRINDNTIRIRTNAPDFEGPEFITFVTDSPADALQIQKMVTTNIRERIVTFASNTNDFELLMEISKRIDFDK